MDSNELKEVSIDGCPLIGDGFNGSVYRLDDETIVKVYKILILWEFQMRQAIRFGSLLLMIISLM